MKELLLITILAVLFLIGSIILAKNTKKIHMQLSMKSLDISILFFKSKKQRKKKRKTSH